MRYLLDTDTCIYIINKKPPEVLKRLMRLDPAQVAISVVTMSELFYGAAKSKNVDANLNALKNFLLPLNVLQWTTLEASVAGHLRADLEKTGKSIGPYDIMIAAQALSLSLTLVTNNEREFSRIPELKIENWT